MFKNLISVLRNINFTLGRIDSALSESFRRPFEPGYFYIVELAYEDCESKSTRLFSLEEVNNFINFVGLVRRPTSVKIFKKLDDGR